MCRVEGRAFNGAAAALEGDRRRRRRRAGPGPRAQWSGGSLGAGERARDGATRHGPARPSVPGPGASRRRVEAAPAVRAGRPAPPAALRGGRGGGPSHRALRGRRLSLSGGDSSVARPLAP